MLASTALPVLVSVLEGHINMRITTPAVYSYVHFLSNMHIYTYTALGGRGIKKYAPFRYHQLRL